MLLIKRIFCEHKFSSQEFGRHFKNSFFWLFKHTEWQSMISENKPFHHVKQKEEIYIHSKNPS